MWQRIINEIPPHRTFIEAFAGSATVWRKIKPAEQSFVIDICRSAIDAWREAASSDIRTRFLLADFIDLARSALSAMPAESPEGKLAAAMQDPDTVVYLDPPYVFETRGDRRYKHELGEELEHRELLRWFRGTPCRALLSGFPSELYEEQLAGVRSISYPTMTRGGVRTETLWMNYPPARSLHDARYAGGGFRERERIKRRAESWASMLMAMGAAERSKVMEACLEAWREASSSTD